MRYKRKTPKQPAAEPIPPLDPPTAEGFIEIAQRSTQLRELQILWRNATQMGLRTNAVEDVLRQRAAELKCINKIGEQK